jgi:hypothetical protein
VYLLLYLQAVAQGCLLGLRPVTCLKVVQVRFWLALAKLPLLLELLLLVLLLLLLLPLL